jgi:hypothetical protein
MTDTTNHPIPPAPPRPTAGPKPRAPYLVESNYHIPLEQEDGSVRELVLPVRIGYRRMKRMLAELTGDSTDQLEQMCELLEVDASALEEAADYVDVLAGSQAYFEAIQDLAVARLGESQRSSNG